MAVATARLTLDTDQGQAAQLGGYGASDDQCATVQDVNEADVGRQRSVMDNI